MSVCLCVCVSVATKTAVKAFKFKKVARGVAQYVAQGVSGAAKDGGVKVFVLPSSSSGGTHAQHTRAAPHDCSWAVR